MNKTYDLFLIDWILTGLNKDKLEEAVDLIKNNKSLDDIITTNETNRRYIDKILREEVDKQFSSENQPLVQVALNSIDSKPDDWTEDYNINMRLGKNGFFIGDQGVGMSLDEILRLLIIPFGTEKNKFETLGWRGVGFLSCLEYCNERPKRNKVIVETQKEDERYLVEFYSVDGTVRGLRMKVRGKRSTRSRGTSVIIKRKFPKSNPVRYECQNYLEDHLRNIPAYRANIYLNGEFINKPSGKIYSIPVRLNLDGKEVTQKVGLLLNEHRHYQTNKPENSNMINLTSQGVLVKKLPIDNYIGATVFFPPAVQVVEGWDEFKINDIYKLCIGKVFEALDTYIQNEKKTDEFLTGISGLIPDLASLLAINALTDIPNIDELRQRFLEGKKYVLTRDEFEHYKPFLGNLFEQRAFVASSQNCSYWRALYGSRKEVNKDFLMPVEKFTPKEFKDEIIENFYPNLQLLCIEANAEIKELYKRIVLVDITPHGNSTVFVFI